MKRSLQRIRANWFIYSLAVLAVLAIAFLLLYRLGTLVHGLNQTELRVAAAPYGWHGIFNHPLFLPLDVLRSIIFRLDGSPSQFLIRLPNVLIGGATILSFGFLMKFWHGTQVAVISTILFAASSWTLHVSRLGSNDALYYLALPLLLLINALLKRYAAKAIVLYGSLIAIGLVLYTPGMLWIVAIIAYRQRHEFQTGFKAFRKLWQRILLGIAALFWLPLLLISFVRSNATFRLWLGLPLLFKTLGAVSKQLAGVFVHLFIRGPEYTNLWLGKLPILDIFSLVLSIIGIYYYVRNYRAQRSKILLSTFLVGVVLIAIGGSVSLSLLVPVLYMLAAAGIAYLLRHWYRRFPENPFASSFAVGCITLAVIVSCSYNIRSYYIAWAQDPATEQSFRLKR